MATINELRQRFDSMDMAQKKQFIVNLRAKVESGNNPEHKRFLSECVQKYREEAQPALVGSGVSRPRAPSGGMGGGRVPFGSDGLLFTGTGKGSSAIRFYWICNIAYCVASALIVYFIYQNAMDRYRARSFLGYTYMPMPRVAGMPLSTLMTLIAAVGIATILLIALFTQKAIEKTEIRVYRNRVEGKSVSKYFLFGDLRSIGFRLTYDQITSVDTSRGAVTIHASGMRYKCYSNNYEAIQAAILNQLGALR